MLALGMGVAAALLEACKQGREESTSDAPGKPAGSSQVVLELSTGKRAGHPSKDISGLTVFSRGGFCAPSASGSFKFIHMHVKSTTGAPAISPQQPSERHACSVNACQLLAHACGWHATISFESQLIS